MRVWRLRKLAVCLILLGLIVILVLLGLLIRGGMGKERKQLHTHRDVPEMLNNDKPIAAMTVLRTRKPVSVMGIKPHKDQNMPAMVRLRTSPVDTITKYKIQRIQNKDGVVFYPNGTNNTLKLIHHYPLAVNMTELVQHIRLGHAVDVDPINNLFFTFPLKPHSCARGHSYFMIYLIKTRPGAFKKRHAIRKTWGNESVIPEVKIKRIFLIGKSKLLENRLKILEESEIEKDILQGDFEDDYEHTTTKTLMGFRWAVTSCAQAKFLVFADDDVLLRPRVITKTLTAAKINQIDKLYMGYFEGGHNRVRRNEMMGPPKDMILTGEMYPFKRYPIVAPAGTYFVNMEYARDVDIAARYIKHLPHDDVFLAVVAKKLEIPVVSTAAIIVYKHTNSEPFFKNHRLIAQCEDCLSFCLEFPPKRLFSFWSEIETVKPTIKEAKTRVLLKI